jgi:hypothetical protein
MGTTYPRYTFATCSRKYRSHILKVSLILLLAKLLLISLPGATHADELTISLTVTAFTTDVCRGSDVRLSFDYTLRNNSSTHNWEGSFGDQFEIISSLHLLPNETYSFYTQGDIIINVDEYKNSALASGKFDDTEETLASAKTESKITGHPCTISISKTPDPSSLCGPQDTEITFTFEVTNNSNFFDVYGSIVDDDFGDIGNFNLVPGASQSYTRNTTINSPMSSYAEAEGNFSDQAETYAFALVLATVGYDTEPPSITCRSDTTVVTCDPDGAVVEFIISATDNCSDEPVISCSPASGSLFPVGTTTVNCTATDDASNLSTCSFDVTVEENNQPPDIADISVSPDLLWPPDNKMQDVVVNYTVSSVCLTQCRLEVSSNEPVVSTGLGDKSPDWEIIDANTLKLRAERAGSGNGRIYTIDIICTDNLGNVNTVSTEVTVPHDMSRRMVTAEAEDAEPGIPVGQYELYESYPNPFNPTTTIRFDIPEPSIVRLTVYDVVGREIATLYEGSVDAGRYQQDWTTYGQSGKTVSSGIYFIQLTAISLSDGRKFQAMNKVLLMK